MSDTTELRNAICEAINRPDLPPINRDDAYCFKVLREWCAANNVVMTYDYFPGRAAHQHEVLLDGGQWERWNNDQGETFAEAACYAWLAAIEAFKEHSR